MVLIMKSQLKLLSPVFQKLVLSTNLPSLHLSLFLLSLNADKVDKVVKQALKRSAGLPEREILQTRIVLHAENNMQRAISDSCSHLLRKKMYTKP